jgi:hypothetical protein
MNMACWWDEDHKLLLLTREEFAALPDGEVLTCIDDTTAIKGLDEIDDDTRGGHIPYGVTGNHPLRVAQLERMTSAPAKEAVKLPQHKVWQCKIGVLGELPLPPGADGPMRRAVEEAFFSITGQHATFNFSGWAAQLDPYEMEVAAPSPSGVPF